jgi:anti-sigma factor RsiW
MKCREFHQFMADWVRGKLPEDNADRMTLHCAECRSCAEEVAFERSLRAGFESFTPLTRTPDLWERIEARVETVKQPRFAFRLPRVFALSGALAAGVLFAAVAIKAPKIIGPPPVGPVIAENKKPGVLEQFRTIRMTETETVHAFSDTPSGNAAAMLLVGGPGR